MISTKEKKANLELAKKLIKRIEKSGFKHSHIAEKVNATEETFSRFMALKPDYVTTRLCTAVDKFLTEENL